MLRRVLRDERLAPVDQLFVLPPDAQQILRILLLVPVGALLAALLGNVVGLNTFGTFMPILIAIAFRQTELAYGLSLFGAIIAVGYVVRLGLERYKLLLVPRLSAILTFVIGIIAFVALLGHHLAMRNNIAVGLFPMVILTMTIERFHVVAEETGCGPRWAWRFAPWRWPPPCMACSPGSTSCFCSSPSPNSSFSWPLPRSPWGGTWASA